MARPGLSPAKAVLLAVQLAHSVNIPALRALVAQNPKTLNTELVLRIVLTHLPESLNSSEYVGFVLELVEGTIEDVPDQPVDSSVLEGLNEKDATKKVRKLHLLSVAWPGAPPDVPADIITHFLIHRSLRIDEATGLITQVPALVTPFLERSSYLRTWFISTILPLIRFNYEYHPQDTANISISAFERLDDEAGIRLLLSRTQAGEGNYATIGRDLRGLVGPWMYGDNRSKRRKLRSDSSFSMQTIAPLNEAPVLNEKCASWEEVFKWVLGQATTSWRTAVQAVEQWDGPGDVDLGGYGDGSIFLDEDDQRHLELRYARSALAAAYLIPEASMQALEGVQKILSRITGLLDFERIPTLEVAGALLSPVTGLDDILSPKNAIFLRNGLLEEQNVLTTPNKESLKLLHALLISSYLFARERRELSVSKAGQMAFSQDEHQQRVEFISIVAFGSTRSPHKGDDKYWIRLRNEVLWMRSLGAEEIGEGTDSMIVAGRGILGKLSKEHIEVEILKGLLANSRFALAKSIYETSTERPIPWKVLQDTIICSAMEAYDNATNPNKTRGGVKRCHDILNAFPDILETCHKADQAEHLVQLTHDLGEYRLILKQGEPFQPVALRVHGDPISILGKILDQNPRSYTKINEFIRLSKEMVKSGLTVRDTAGFSHLQDEQTPTQESIAEKRAVAMCISAALAENDFETAYSYVTSHLSDIAGKAHTRIVTLDQQDGLSAEPPPENRDDWSWKAALEAGRYRRTSETTKPTHLGNASGNPEIRHLEQRMDCLSHALRFAPRSALQEVLNVYRRCEEELQTQLKLEEEQEDAWDVQGDNQAMPGGFGVRKTRAKTTPTTGEAESPMNLFDLTQASMARAQSGLSALANLPINISSSQAGVQEEQRQRKRDQVKSLATGALASGVGWLIGATPARTSEDD